MGELVERVDEQDHVVAVVDRGEAIRERWLHRVATIVCGDGDGRILVHRRPADVSHFPGQFNWMLGGAVDVGESYEDAATGELAEELGIRACPRFVLNRTRFPPRPQTPRLHGGHWKHPRPRGILPSLT